MPAIFAFPILLRSMYASLYRNYPKSQPADLPVARSNLLPTGKQFADPNDLQV